MSKAKETPEMQGPMIHRSMLEAMRNISAVGKLGEQREGQGGRNFNFRRIEDMYNRMHGVLSDAGIFVAPTLVKYVHELIPRAPDREGASKAPFVHVMIEMDWRFTAADGSYVSVITPGEGTDVNDKATNKAMSASFKYALAQTFLVPFADMDDSDRENPVETHEGGGRYEDPEPPVEWQGPRGPARATVSAPAPASTPPAPPPRPTGQPISKAQVNRLWAIARHKGWPEDQVYELLGRYGVEHPEDLTRAKTSYDAVIAELEAR